MEFPNAQKGIPFAGAKYGEEEDQWCSADIKGTYMVSVWKHFRTRRERFSQYVKFLVGDGSCFRFWHDAWCGDLY